MVVLRDKKMTKIQTFQYYLIISVFRIITLIPLKILFLISEIITLFVYHIIGYRKKVIIENLKYSFPKKSETEIKHIARKYYRHLSIMIVENIFLRFVTTKDFSQRIILENKEIFDTLYKENRNAIVMLGHFGNWEFTSGLTRLLPYTGAAVYKQLSNPVFDKLYFNIRERLGVQPVEMNEVLRKVLELNQQKTPYLLFMVADQAPVSKNSHWIKFLNQETNVFLGSEKIAKKFNMPVIYLEVIRYKKGIYRMIPQVITNKPQETDTFEITEKYFNLLEDSIKRSPRYWLWSHRRWKHEKVKSELKEKVT